MQSSFHKNQIALNIKNNLFGWNRGSKYDLYRGKSPSIVSFHTPLQ